MIYFASFAVCIGIPTVNNCHSDFARRRGHCTLKDRSLRLLGVGSCASSMFVTPIDTMFPVVFSVREQRRRAVDNSAGVKILSRFVTESK